MFARAKAQAEELLQNAESDKTKTEAEAGRIREEAQQDAERMVHNARLQADKLGREAAELYVQKVRQADDHWSKITTDLEQFYDQHEGLREMLKMIGSVNA